MYRRRICVRKERFLRSSGKHYRGNIYVSLGPFTSFSMPVARIVSSSGVACSILRHFLFLDGLKEIVPCYNAMLLEAYGRLSLTESRQAQAALRWSYRIAFSIQLSKNASCPSVWNQCSPFSITVRFALCAPIN